MLAPSQSLTCGMLCLPVLAELFSNAPDSFLMLLFKGETGFSYTAFSLCHKGTAVCLYFGSYQASLIKHIVEELREVCISH